MTDGLRENPLDWLAEPFFPDGSVDWEAARRWIGAVHTALSRALGPDTWTDTHAGWLGRFAHDTLRYQGVTLAEATPDDLEDLLFTLQPAQADTAPGPAEHMVDTLLHFFRYGAEHHGSVAAAAAVEWLEDDDELAVLVAGAMHPEGLTREQKRAIQHRGRSGGSVVKAAKKSRSLPKRKKGRKKRRK